MSNNKKKWIIPVAAVGTVAVGVPLAGVLLAGTATANETAPPTTTSSSVPAEDLMGFWEPTAEEIAEINAVEQELAAYLAERGIACSEVTEDGVTYVVLARYDQASVDAYDSFWAEKYPLDAEAVAELNAETAAMVADLAEQGFEVTTHTLADGLVALDWEQGEDVEDAIDAWNRAQAEREYLFGTLDGRGEL